MGRCGAAAADVGRHVLRRGLNAQYQEKYPSMAHDFENILAATDFCKYFPGSTALDHVNFTLRRGEVHALLGENGAGKSTLIKCMTGAYRPDSGSLLLDGAEIHPHDTLAAQRLGIGTVYQEVNLLPNLSVAENLFLGRQPRQFGL